jgi:quercetin dioxygenase-like cupin family protein
MSIPHAQSGDLIDVTPLGTKLPEQKTHTLLKTDNLEVLRLVLPAGKTIAEHKAPGEITVQCIEGEVQFTSMGQTQTLRPGQMLYLSAAEPHALEATKDSSMLVTILLSGK